MRKFTLQLLIIGAVAVLAIAMSGPGASNNLRRLRRLTVALGRCLRRRHMHVRLPSSRK
jgi:hypothetical protein